MLKNKSSQTWREPKFDKVLLAILLININAPLLEITMRIIKHFGWIRLSLVEDMSLLVLKTPNFWVGCLMGLFYGAWVAMFTCYSTTFLGTNHFLIKAIFINMSIESWLFNIFGILAKNELLTLNVRENIINASLTAFAGVINGLIMQKFILEKTEVRKGDAMKCDKILLAMLFGILPIPLVEGLCLIAKHLGFTTLSCLEILSLMWLKKPSWFLGILAMLGIGAWIGLLIYHSHRFLGVDYFPIKAMVLETTMILMVFMIFGTLGGNELLIESANTVFAHILFAMGGGIGTGLLMRKYLFKA